MVMDIRLRFSQDNAVWEEDYLFAEGEPSLTAIHDELVKRRLDLLCRPCVLQASRRMILGDPHSLVAVDIDIEGAARAFNLGVAFRGEKEFADVPERTLMLRFRTATGGRKLLWFGGGPQAISRYGLIFDKRALVRFWWLERLDDFMQWLVTEPGLLVRRRRIPPDVAQADVKAIAVSPDGLFLITTSRPFATRPGQQLTLHGSRGRFLSRLRGVRTVKAIVDPLTFTLDTGPLPYGDPVVYYGGCRVRALAYWYEPVSIASTPYELRCKRRKFIGHAPNPASFNPIVPLRR